MINRESQPYLSLRDKISGIFSPPPRKEEFWALKDVSFNVYPGESIGIIGRNGAGKSTLLKILSKITPPTSGKIISRGRIASLLEVGTGFHPELTGRENIYMNGSILGMRRKEIQKNFDAIVDFAGVEKFIDTPLKHYSSGMQLRLAFAVAAFLENEILVIDEVLAVGDAEFQKKCLGKMEDVSKSGRTVLFVSHNMGAITNLCSTSVLLRNGHLVMHDKSSLVISEYLKDVKTKANLKDIYEDELISFKSLFIKEGNNLLCENVIKRSQAVDFYFEFYIKSALKFNFGVLINSLEGYPVLNLISRSELLKEGAYTYSFGIPKYFLNDGYFSLDISLVKNQEILIKHFTDLISFRCIDDENDKEYNGTYKGGIRIRDIKLKLIDV